ncbi:MAG: hypothetical protein ACI4IE_09025 [Eubacterium sp.]
MATLQQIGAQVGLYEGKVCELGNKIKDLEKSYSELLEFKGMVQSSQSEFGSSNNTKMNALNQLQSLSAYNNIAKKFSDAMKGALYGIGSKILNIAYSFLLSKIKAELRKIRNEISNCENTIKNYNQKIQKYKDDYRKEKARLEEDN